jgi:hypothetical protein
MRTRFIPASIAIALCVAAPPLAQAQMLFNQIGNSGDSSKPPPGTPPKTSLPPALPGAASTGNAAPARNIPTDMEPNDALFDAINRGDIGAAREAISRGADLHGTNVLGMTPLELSVDLGRNDISFLLLSMRAPDDSKARHAPAVAAKQPPVKQAKQVPPRPPARVAASGPAPSQTARLYSGDGGSPNPDAGFLGFDPGRR